MSWIRERDELIAQTLAFVQSVTDKREENGRRNAAPLLPTKSENALASEAPSSVARPSAAPICDAAAGVTPTPITAANIAPPPRDTPPISQTEMANEIRTRVASFRAHQERFNREREEYFASTIARLRAAIKDVPPPRLRK
jgi:hypothetical protein